MDVFPMEEYIQLKKKKKTYLKLKKVSKTNFNGVHD